MNGKISMGAAVLLLAACTVGGGEMERQLDAVRVLIKQSALMAANAACGGEAKDALLRASAVMNRRAMGGPEMAKIHKMMGMQPGESGMDMGRQKQMSAEMQRHAVLHDAGEAVFDFLGAVGEGKVSCAQAEPVRMAAAAAMLREAGSGEPERAARELARRVDAGKRGQLPQKVAELVEALGGI